MLDVCLLGTSGMMPLPERFLTSCMVRYNGHSFLIDCGESTQTSIRMKGWSFKDIDVLMITHFHADHISGLPGMLLAMTNSGKTDPLTIVGPKGIGRVVNSLRVIAPEISFEISFIELDNYTTLNLYGLTILAFKVKHGMPCFGYTFKLNRLGKFDPEAAKRQNIPLQYWNRLQHGESIDGFTPDMVMSAPRKGLKVTYCTDTRPTESIVEYAKNSDLFICEGMYGENAEETKTKARQKKHMLMTEAANIALVANVKRLWLTHFSPSMINPKQYEKSLNKIFSNTVVGEDRMTVTLTFDEE